MFFFVSVSCLEFLSGRIAKCNLLLYLRHLIVKWFSFNYFACGIITLVWCVFFIFCLVVLVYLTHYTFAPFLAAKISSVLFSTLWKYSLLLLLYHHYAVLSPCDYLIIIIIVNLVSNSLNFPHTFSAFPYYSVEYIFIFIVCLCCVYFLDHLLFIGLIFIELFFSVRSFNTKE